MNHLQIKGVTQMLFDNQIWFYMKVKLFRGKAKVSYKKSVSWKLTVASRAEAWIET